MSRHLAIHTRYAPTAFVGRSGLEQETGHGTTFTDLSTLGRVVDQWITDPTTTRTRSAGTVARFQHAITHSNRRYRSSRTPAAPITSSSTDVGNVRASTPIEIGSGNAPAPLSPHASHQPQEYSTQQVKESTFASSRAIDCQISRLS